MLVCEKHCREASAGSCLACRQHQAHTHPSLLNTHPTHIQTQATMQTPLAQGCSSRRIGSTCWPATAPAGHCTHLPAQARYCKLEEGALSPTESAPSNAKASNTVQHKQSTSPAQHLGQEVLCRLQVLLCAHVTHGLLHVLVVGLGQVDAGEQVADDALRG